MIFSTMMRSSLRTVVQDQRTGPSPFMLCKWVSITIHFVLPCRFFINSYLIFNTDKKYIKSWISILIFVPSTLWSFVEQKAKQTRKNKKKIFIEDTSIYIYMGFIQELLWERSKTNLNGQGKTSTPFPSFLLLFSSQM